MVDEKIDEQFAEGLLKSLWGDAQAAPDSPYEVLREGDATVLLYRLPTPYGKMEVRFIPSAKLAQNALGYAKRISDQILDIPITQDEVDEWWLRDEHVEPEELKILETETAKWFLSYYANCLPASLFLAVGVTSNYAYLINLAHSQSSKMRAVTHLAGNVRKVKPPRLNKLLNKVVALNTKAIRDLLVREMKKVSSAPSLDQIATYYKRLYPIWTDIQSIFKEHGETPNWRATVAAKYGKEGFSFDDDLLTRITGDLNSLSEELQTLIIEKGGESTPSSIAIEHAARMCGTWKYQCSARYYFEKVNETSTEQNSEGQFSK